MKLLLLVLCLSGFGLRAEEIIIDDADKKQFEVFGKWIQTDGLKGFVGKGYLHDDGTKTKNGLYVRFSPIIEAEGTEGLYVVVDALKLVPLPKDP